MSIDTQYSKDTVKIFKVLIRTVSLLFLLCDLSCQWGRSIIDSIWYYCKGDIANSHYPLVNWPLSSLILFIIYVGPTKEIYENLPHNKNIQNVGRTWDIGYHCGGWPGHSLLGMSSEKYIISLTRTRMLFFHYYSSNAVLICINP